MLAYELIFYGEGILEIKAKAVTGMDRESAHLLQLNTRKRSCCTASYLGVPDWDNLSVTPGFAAVQQLPFLVLSCNGWADYLSNPVMAF